MTPIGGPMLYHAKCSALETSSTKRPGQHAQGESMHTKHKVHRHVSMWHLGHWLLLACAWFALPSWAATPNLVAEIGRAHV